MNYPDELFFFLLQFSIAELGEGKDPESLEVWGGKINSSDPAKKRNSIKSFSSRKQPQQRERTESKGENGGVNGKPKQNNQ